MRTLNHDASQVILCTCTAMTDEARPIRWFRARVDDTLPDALMTTNT